MTLPTATPLGPPLQNDEERLFFVGAAVDYERPRRIAAVVAREMRKLGRYEDDLAALEL